MPIKDIKMFIKSIAYINSLHSDFHVSIIGPTDEDPEYYEQCLKLIDLFELKNVITFTGNQKMTDWYPEIDILVLSSISEGQPIVMLEAFCYQIPVVATDVGSCAELIYGSSAKDKELGQCGYIVPFGQSKELGDAIMKLLNDPQIISKFGAVAKKRVELFYDENNTIKSFIKLYKKNSEGVI